MGSLHDMERRYGKDPDAKSHGEAFLGLFRNRFVPGGLYLLDEPEAPLSPQNQIGLLALLLELVKQNAQGIIATHSPIIMAFPGALIYSFDGVTIQAVKYDELDHVSVTRAFLENPGRVVRQLALDGDAI